jgi:argininosuccinate lyase
MTKEKLWGGRFSSSMAKEVEAFGCSIEYDKYLLDADVKASKVHLQSLNDVGLVTNHEAAKIDKALDELCVEYKEGSFTLDPSLEDVHMNIESYLINKCGDVGKKIHTGRSRNDQVVTAFKLTIKENLTDVYGLLLELLETLISLAEKADGLFVPGYTHLQKAQPVRLSHYYLAYFEQFLRDLKRVKNSHNLLDECPLGASALAGSPFSVDRKKVAADLGFSTPTHNSMDSVSDRDYVLDATYTFSMIMQHFSRLSEDIILWASDEFNYLTISDAYTTGSSIMPQKKNPDISELTRGKTGKVYGALTSLLTLMKGIPMTYNRDLQEDKPAYFEAYQTIISVLKVNIGLLNNISFNEDSLNESVNEGYLLATDLADYLVNKGMAFRDAHHVVGQIVAYGLDKEKGLLELTFDELSSFSSVIDEDVMSYLSVSHSTNNRDVFGGTAESSVKEQIKLAKKRIKLKV